MSQFRLVEHPKGKWSVEKKGWFGWKGVFFYGDPLVFSTISGLAAAHSPLPVGSVFTFKSERAARSALKVAIENLSVRNVISVEEAA